MANVFDTIRENKGGVIEVTEEIFWYALEVLPPIDARHCFGMGETADFTSDGVPEYYFFGSIMKPDAVDKNDRRYFGFLGTQKAAENVFAGIKGKTANLE